jgi:DNA-directed RNA polymerase subunit alpha
LEKILPKVECLVEARNYAKFSIGYLERGFGTTIGNALRRVLLSSIPGAAVTSIRVSGIYHEFAPLPHCKETMLELILNVKKIRLKLHGEDSAKLRMLVTRAGEFTAGDLECPPYVEIVNPEQYLLTADSDEVDLEIEMTVQRGKGYSPAEERKRLPVGEIAVDAIFNPVRRVSFEVQSAQAGHLSKLERLIMEIWTDGTISPEEALKTAAGILVQHFAFLTEAEAIPKARVEEKVKAEEIEALQLYKIGIDEIGLSTRVYNALRRAGIFTLGEIIERLSQGSKGFEDIRNFGPKAYEELVKTLEERGFLKETLQVGSKDEAQSS